MMDNEGIAEHPPPLQRSRITGVRTPSHAHARPRSGMACPGGEFQDLMLTEDAFEAHGTARFSVLKSRMGRLRPKKHGWWDEG